MDLRMLIHAVVLTAAVGALSPPAWAGGTADHRYAVVIGSNLGEPGEEALAYAERDATRVAEVLTRLGGVEEENLILLRGSTASAVERVLATVGQRIRDAQATDSATRAMLFVYYSGHADATAMHLGLTKLKFARARELLGQSESDVNVLVVDACRSGGLTRVKGAVPAEPFQIRAEDNLDATGLAIITSSAAGEDAQESDRLKSGVFTHHLVNGLVGAADASRDGRVTLSEAYRYAYNQTLRTTSRTQFVQHPTFAFHMQGRQELILTRLEGASGFGRLRLQPPGSYVLMEGTDDGAVVAELGTEGDTEVLLAPGQYIVRRRGNTAVHEATANISHGETTVLAAGDMSTIPYGHTVRKGYATQNYVWSVGAGAELSAPPASDLSMGIFGAVGAQVDLEALSMQMRIRYGRADGANSDLAVTQDMLGGDVGAYKVFDLFSRGSVNMGLGLGIRAGVDWFYQQFDTDGVAPARSQVVGRAAPVVRFELSPSSALNTVLDCGAEIYLMDKAGKGFDAPVVPFCSLGFGVYIP